MSIRLANLVLGRKRVGHVVALLFLAFGIFTNGVATADRLSGLTIKSFCADPQANFDALERSLKPRMRMATTDRNYDEIYSGVLMRIVKDCLERADRDVKFDLKTYVRNVRIEIARKPTAIEYREEIMDLAPPESMISPSEILDVVRKTANPRQQMVFEMLVQGLTQQEVAEHLGVSLGTVNSEKAKIAELLKAEFQLASPSNKRSTSRPLGYAQEPVAQFPSIAPAEPATMARVRSPLGAEIVKAIKGGAAVIPTGTYAGTSMTVKVARTQLSAGPVDGVVMLPTPIILSSNTSGEQEMVVSAIRETGEAGQNTRTFALYAFCKDKHLETPSDLSRYVFKSTVTDQKMIDIVTRGDLRQPEAISERLWKHLGDG